MQKNGSKAEVITSELSGESPKTRWQQRMEIMRQLSKMNEHDKKERQIETQMEILRKEVEDEIEKHKNVKINKEGVKRFRKKVDEHVQCAQKWEKAEGNKEYEKTKREGKNLIKGRIW